MLLEQLKQFQELMNKSRHLLGGEPVNSDLVSLSSSRSNHEIQHKVGRMEDPVTTDRSSKRLQPSSSRQAWQDAVPLKPTGKRHFSKTASHHGNHINPAADPQTLKDTLPISLPSFQNYIGNELKISQAEERLMKMQLMLSTIESRFFRLSQTQLKSNQERQERDALQE